MFTEAAGSHLAEVIDAKGLQVHLHLMAVGNFGQTCHNGRVAYGLPAVKSPSARQPDDFAFPGAPGDGCVRRTGVGGGELERVRAKILTAPQPDGKAASGKSPVLLEPTSLLSGPFQSGEGLGARPGIGIAAGRRHVQIRRRAGQTQQERCA